MKINTLSGDFDRTEFLQKYWQKEPVLLRGLFPNFVDPLSAEELAGCACEEQVESRVVTEFTAGDFALRSGPFEEKDFTSLPDSHWTLLVQAMDQWFDELADLRDEFDFIPSWRVDDVMISFACDQAGVGPHFDNYDVFLLQGKGQRRWRLGQRCDDASPLREGSDLRLLDSFETSADFELSAGDALYVPPRLAHWGTSIGDSLCYSIGFRAPSNAEMIEGFSDFLIRRSVGEDRFEDPAPRLAADASEIDPSALEPSFARILQQVNDPALFRQWFGCHVTQPKYPELIEALDEPSLQILEAALEDAQSVRQHPSSRFAHMRGDGETHLLFVNGSAAAFASSKARDIGRLCSRDPIDGEELDRFLDDAILRELLLKLLEEGSLLLA